MEFLNFFSKKNPWRVCEFPPPYQTMLAFNSDVECTSWTIQQLLFRQMEDWGLETSFSFWFWADPELTWRLFEEDADFSAESEIALELIQKGFLDTLHSFGGVTHGKGTRISRTRIIQAYEKLKQKGIR